MPHDSLCNEGFKNVYLVGVRNVEGQNTYGHTVCFFDEYTILEFLLSKLYETSLIFDEKEKSKADAKGVTGDQGCLPRLAIDQNLPP